MRLPTEKQNRRKNDLQEDNRGLHVHNHGRGSNDYISTADVRMST